MSVDSANVPPDSVKKVENEAILLALSRIGLGLAGFGGLISALKHGGQAWSLQDVGALNLLMEHAIGLMLLAMLPLVVRFFVNTECLTWRISSAFMFLFFVIETLTQVLRVINFSEKGAPLRHPIAFVTLFLVINAVAAGLAVTNVRTGQASRYVFCLYWILISGTLQLWFLIRSSLGL